MTRLAVIVEGETEEDFVAQALADTLSERGIFVTARLPGKQGGNITVERLAAEIARLLPGFDYVTTLVDFYGFRNRPTDSPDALEQAIHHGANAAASYRLDESRLIPYVQLHEFEALLFSDVSAFRVVLGVGESDIRRLADVRSQFGTPEDINDNYLTAPSRRIKATLPSYSKRLYGPRIARAIGIERIRAECPRFAAWIHRLESLV